MLRFSTCWKYFGVRLPGQGVTKSITSPLPPRGSSPYVSVRVAPNSLQSQGCQNVVEAFWVPDETAHHRGRKKKAPPPSGRFTRKVIVGVVIHLATPCAQSTRTRRPAAPALRSTAAGNVKQKKKKGGGGGRGEEALLTFFCDALSGSTSKDHFTV